MKTYLIIGAGPGIGIATARRFAREGFRIVLASRTGKSVAAQVEDLRAGGAEVVVETVDAADPRSVTALVQRHGAALAVLHYNAGVLHYDAKGELQARTLAQESVDSLSSDMQTNLVSALAAVKAAEAAMAPRSAGTILLTGGGFGVEPTPAFINVSVAKAGLRAAAKALFEPMKKQGLHLATATVSTLVAAGSDKAEEIAEAFWRLHAQDQAQWAWEVVIS
jgi:NAD(P)-dependent dehydrogenase (short-subunit alcohol dehydrogenase family)